MAGLKVILCGYHWTGCRVLEHLLGRGDVAEAAVFTHEASGDVPDLARLSAEKGVWCSTTDVSKSELPFTPDIIASVYYRFIIKAPVIRACKGKIFNMHPSLLPRHRGCSSVPWAIIEGDTVTGVTFHYIDEKIDTGLILLQAAVPIEAGETQGTLFTKCMERGVQFWPAAFELVKAGVPGVPQQGSSCYHPRGAPHDGQIDPSWPEEKIERFIRAMTFPPYPYAKLNGHEVRSMADYRRIAPGGAGARS